MDCVTVFLNDYSPLITLSKGWKRIHISGSCQHEIDILEESFGRGFVIPFCLSDGKITLLEDEKYFDSHWSGFICLDNNKVNSIDEAWNVAYQYIKRYNNE